ncbi:MAG: indole-3-glycerol phosphate synthase TrpC [bacterium]|nr:indole-3-glycerol phosphate synthase TrpC [bacterium]
MDILEELSALRRADAAELERMESYDALVKRAATMSAPLDFRGAFRGDGLRVISELKKASPSEGVIRENFDPAAIAREYEANGAAAMSVLCEPHRFLGGDNYLQAVRQTVKTPLIYKDFITTPYQVARARACGADAILLIAAVLADEPMKSLMDLAHAFGMVALVETHTLEEIKRAVGIGARLMGVNCRNLRTFKTDPAITAELIAKIPSDVTRIAESGLKTHADLLTCRAAGADGFLIGTTLMRAPSPGAKLRELLGT